MSDYEFKTEPFSHQRNIFYDRRDRTEDAVLWEQGTGKSKLIIDNVAYLYEKGLIDAALIVAPNGVDREWIEDLVPTHLPDRVARRTFAHLYQTSRAGTKWHQSALRRAVRHDGLALVAAPYELFRTKKGKAFAWKFLKDRRVFYTLDEFTMIKTPSAKRTISVVASGRYAAYKRIMDGTPIAQGPFDIYSPVRFLDEGFWKRLEIPDFPTFRHHFAIYETAKRKDNDQEFEFVVAYRRLDELHEILAPISTRVLKDDVLDLPPKLYNKLYFDLSPEQRRVYDDLKAESMAFLDETRIVTTPLAITRLLRLQQVTCGYVPVDDEEPVALLGDKNPRLDQAAWWADHLPHKGIIWARFRMDIDLLMRRLGSRAVRYDGAVSEDRRAENKRRFKTDDSVQFFVANPAAASRGLTLNEAKSELYYSNSFKLLDRLQSEDRAHRAGQTQNVNITDLMAPGTVDTKIVRSLRDKRDIANRITGDELRDWI